MGTRVVSIGINQYPINQLSGCINDVKLLLKTLIDTYHVKPSRTRACVDGRATAAGILARYADAVETTCDGDYCIVHFSGHGTQVASRDATSQEPDGLDEILCPVDFDWDNEATWIRDNDLIKVLKPRWPHSRILLISDSCHSGGLVDAANSRLISRADYSRPRYLRPPADIEWRNESAETPIKRLLAKAVTMPGIACISGCLSTQTSADAYIGGRAQGACTWALCSAIKASPKSSVRDIVEAARNLAHSAGYDQTINCSGDESILDTPIPTE